MEDINSSVSLIIESYPREKYKLSFLILEDGTPCMPSFQFNYKGIEEFWDNEEYLTSLYRTLDNSINKTHCHPFELIIHEVIEYGLYPDREVILEMFNKAIKLGVWEK